jgi:geranylgeranyl diphosphate synthase type II
MYTQDQLHEKISNALDALPIHGEPIGLYEPISYTLNQSGKRIRPLFVLVANQIFGGDPVEALPAATAIEIFHNFTLLHDDIIDQAPLRRGYETVYRKWNTNVAILSGDTMFAIAYGELSKSKPELLPSLMQLFSKTAIEVCEGQQYDIDYELQQHVGLKEYINMIRLKTAVLLAASLKIGAMTAGASEENSEKIYKFGIAMGIAFQLQDDLLDSYGNQAIFGKKTGGDIAINKKTVLFIKAIEKSSDTIRLKLERLYKVNNLPVDEKVSKVMSIFDTLGVKESTEELIQSYFNEACHILDSINIPNEMRAMLTDIASNMIKRVR